MGTRSPSVPRGAMVPLLACLACTLLATSAPSQLIMESFTVSTRAWTPSNSCENAPIACSAGNRDMNLGPHEFHVHHVPWFDAGQFEKVEFRLSWPPGWTLLGWNLCYAEHLSGDPSVMGDRLVFRFPGCEALPQPFLRVWFDCPVPGRFQMHPLTGSGCSGEFGRYNHSDIGDFCGAFGYFACDGCTMFNLQGYSGYFTPAEYELTLATDVGHADTLIVAGDLGPWCYGIPECGEDTPGHGFNEIRSDVPWMEVTLLEHPPYGWQQMPYELRIDTTGLAPGTYEGRVHSVPGCRTVANCMPVTLHVAPVSAVPESTPSLALLGPPSPNPSRGTIHFALHLSEETHVRVIIADASGRLVGQALHGAVKAGTTLHTWSPSEAIHGRLPSGVYFLRAETAAWRTGRMFVLVE